jgi:hypothetical protein
LIEQVDGARSRGQSVISKAGVVEERAYLCSAVTIGRRLIKGLHDLRHDAQITRGSELMVLRGWLWYRWLRNLSKGRRTEKVEECCCQPNDILPVRVIITRGEL